MNMIGLFVAATLHWLENEKKLKVLIFLQVDLEKHHLDDLRTQCATTFRMTI
jgi:small ligand-binding sensory domain FIST